MEQPAVERLQCARIPTEYAEFELCLYANSLDDKEHMALILGDVVGQRDVLTRVHSECFTGDVLGSRRCDCGDQLDRSLELIAREGKGLLLYLRQEGRGIGLFDKLRAYNLQDQGHDTVDANLILGHQADARDYTIAALILQDLKVESIRLLTNNPGKISDLTKLGVAVSDRIPLSPRRISKDNRFYLMTKIERMNHLIDPKDVTPEKTTRVVRK